MIDFSTISAITIPDGIVLSIYQVAAGGNEVLLWRRGGPPVGDDISVVYYDSPSAQITYHDGWDFSQCTMTLSPTSYSYSGDDETYPVISVGKPAVTIEDPAGNALTEGSDYTVSYQPTSGTIASGSLATLSVVAIPVWPAATGQLTETYTATYTRTQPKVSLIINEYTVDAGGQTATIGYTQGAGSYQPNTDVTIRAVTDAVGYTFMKWNDDDTNASRTVNVGSGGATYTAYFKPSKWVINWHHPAPSSREVSVSYEDVATQGIKTKYYGNTTDTDEYLTSYVTPTVKCSYSGFKVNYINEIKS